jgi:hypothetical protein
MIRILCCLCTAVLLNASVARAAIPATAAPDPGVKLPPVAGAGTDKTGELNSNPVRVDRIAFRGNRALTHRYTDHGYFNSGVVLDLDAPYHDGLLSFLAIEGRLSEIRVHGLHGLRSAYVVDRLRGQDDEILNADVLRMRLLNACRLPFCGNSTQLRWEPAKRPRHSCGFLREASQARRSFLALSSMMRAFMS